MVYVDFRTEQIKNYLTKSKVIRTCNQGLNFTIFVHLDALFELMMDKQEKMKLISLFFVNGDDIWCI